MSSQATSGAGTLLKKGDAASPEQFTTVAEARSIKQSGAKLDTADVTNMDSTGNYKEFIPTLFDGGEIDFELNYLPTNATHTGLLTDYDARTKRNWQLVLPSSLGTWSFAGYVVAMDRDYAIDKQMSLSVKIKITGKPTFA